MQERLESLASKAREEIGRAQEASGLETLRVRYLGKKGELSAVLGGMGKLAPDERRRVGEIANRVKAEVETLLDEAQKRIAGAALDAELGAPPIDVPLPGRLRRPGRWGPCWTGSRPSGWWCRERSTAPTRTRRTPRCSTRSRGSWWTGRSRWP